MDGDSFSIPKAIVYACLTATYSGLVGAVVWLAKQLYRERRERRKERRRDALTLKKARFAVEQAEGLPSVAPPPLDQWEDDSAIFEQEKVRDALWLERKLASLEASERTPEHVHAPPYRKKQPSRQG